MVDEPLMVFALTFKLTLLCVATAVLHFDEYVPLKRKPYCLYIATIFGKVGDFGQAECASFGKLHSLHGVNL